MSRILLLWGLFFCFTFTSQADSKIYESESAMESAILQAVESHQEEIEMLCEYSDVQIQIDPADEALGEYGERRFGMNSTLKGVDSFQGLGMIENGLIHYKYKIKYNYSKAEEEQLQNAITEWVDSNLTPDMNETVKAALITKYITDNYRSNESRSYDNAVAAFQYKMANPAGFAELTSRMYTAANLQNMIVTGVTAGPTLHWRAGMPVTLQTLRLARTPADTVSTPDVHAWNLVRLNGSWYHVNIYRYTRFNPQIHSGRTCELFASDAICGMTEGWIRTEYPSANRTLWEGTDAVTDYIKSLFGSILFDYPIAHTTSDFQNTVWDAMKKGKSQVEVRYLKEPGAPGECTPLESKYGDLGLVYCEDGKLLGGMLYYHVELIPKKLEVVYPLEQVPSTINMERGEIFDSAMFLTDPTFIDKPPTILVLTPGHIRQIDRKYEATQTGVAYIAVMNNQKAKNVRIEIQEPKLGILLNGKLLDSADPVIRAGRTLVPLKSLFEAMGALVDYDQSTQTISAIRGISSVQLKLGKKEAVVNGKTIQMDTSVEIIEGRSYVPIRFIAESFGASVNWNPNKNKVELFLADESSTVGKNEN